MLNYVRQTTLALDGHDSAKNVTYLEDNMLPENMLNTINHVFCFAFSELDRLGRALEYISIIFEVRDGLELFGITRLRFSGRR